MRKTRFCSRCCTTRSTSITLNFSISASTTTWFFSHTHTSPLQVLVLSLFPLSPFTTSQNKTMKLYIAITLLSTASAFAPAARTQRDAASTVSQNVLQMVVVVVDRICGTKCHQWISCSIFLSFGVELCHVSFLLSFVVFGMCCLYGISFSQLGLVEHRLEFINASLTLVHP